MALLEVVENALLRFTPYGPNAPANTHVFGFITPDEPPLTLTMARDSARITTGLRDVDYLVYGTSAQFKELLNPEHPNRAEIVAQLRLRPEYPFKNYLLSIILNALDLEIPDLDTKQARFDDSFPFPPRYPAFENPFRFRQYEPVEIPVYDREQLPALVADEHPTWVAMYDKAWQLAFGNLRQPEPKSGFVANFIDTAFNANTFMWDSCFMMMFGRYARRIMPFMGTLDNFYAKQEDDGFICREISTFTGKNIFQSLDPRSTGPNIMAWTELIYYEMSGDAGRLREVFPALMAYHRWLKEWHTHADGSYWTSGLGSGMDNQTRVPHSDFHHRHYSWVDATLQQALNCQQLLMIADFIKRDEFNDELRSEFQHLSHYLKTQMWDENRAFYFDRAPDGELSNTRGIGAYWGLLTSAIDDEHAKHMIAHLNDEKGFKRPHRVPSQAYDSPDYNPYAGYWLGGVWSPTNYTIMRGLSTRGKHDLAHEIAFNHVENVAQVFLNTGTFWENYAPEYVQPGKPARPDFVGWTGLSAISIPIEYLLGIRAIEGGTMLNWDIRLTERHGILRYSLGTSNTVDLVCEARSQTDDSPIVTINTHESLTIAFSWGQHHKQMTLPAGEHLIRL